jgi:hypothetical protein
VERYIVTDLLILEKFYYCQSFLIERMSQFIAAEWQNMAGTQVPAMFLCDQWIEVTPSPRSCEG